ncbi:MAG: hypothetical protein FVQ82_05120 [Planctomycetes bacterium]|nr:hypothetical protein [Planctomycetota bacterium]
MIKYIAMLLCVLLAGCSPYSRKLIEWNMLRPTPYYDCLEKPEPGQWSDDEVTVSWLGHATVLINFQGTTIITDPMLSKRMGPKTLFGNNIGIRRITKTPLDFKELGAIDIVLLSHAHCDHWDIPTLKKFDKTTEAIIPVGNSDITPKGFGKTTELSWGKSVNINDITITAFEVEHWGYRTGSPNTPRGFNGYVIENKNCRIAFFGDSSYIDKDATYLNHMHHNPPAQIPSFDISKAELIPAYWQNRLKEPYYDLCILPIGDYYYRFNHMNPEEAWTLFNLVNGRKILPIHWRTFILSPVPINEPIERLRKAAGAEQSKIICDMPGKSAVLKK